MEFPISKEHARIQTVCLMLIAAILLTFSIYWLKPVLVPLVVALFVVSGISPLLSWLERRLGVHRVVAAGMTFIAGLLAMIAFGLTVWASMIDLSRNADAYRTRVQQIVTRLEESLPEILQPVFAPAASEPRSDRFRRPINEDAGDFIDSLVRDSIARLTQVLIGLVTTSAIVLIYVFFLLIGTSTTDKNPDSMARTIDEQIRAYLLLKTLISIVTGAAFGGTLYLFGVPMALTFGVLAFLLNFVPNIGPIVASLLPIPLVILDPHGSVAWMVAVITLISLIQGFSGNVVEPKLMGNSSDLHPVTVLVALIFWGMMWGIIGMFLATPITAAVRILLSRLEITRPLAELMSGRWENIGNSTAFSHSTRSA